MRRTRAHFYAGGPGSFSPAALFSGGGIGAFYDPTDPSTLFQDSAGTTPATAAGQPVGRLNDKSGNGNHLIQATAAARPTLRLAGGIFTLEADGVDDTLATAGNVDFSTTRQITLVGRVLTNAATSQCMATLSSLNGGLRCNMNSGAAGIWGASLINGGAGVEEVANTNAVPAAAYRTVTALADWNAGTALGQMVLRYDGNQAGQTAWIGPGVARNFASAPLQVFSSAGALFLTGNLKRLLIVGRALTAAELAQAEAWAAAA